MGKDTIIPVKFDRELTFEEIKAFVDHVIDFATAMKMEATYISLDAVKKRVEARTSNDNSGLHLQRVNHCALQQIERVMIEASKCKAKFCMKYVDNEGFTVPIEITEHRTDNILGDISVETIRIDIEHCG